MIVSACPLRLVCLIVLLCMACCSGLSIHGKRFADSRYSLEQHRTLPAPLQMAGLFGEQDSSTNENNVVMKEHVEWQIYIDQSKASLDRGGSATLDAFCSLCPPEKVQIVPSILPKSNKKGPWIRCIFNKKNKVGRGVSTSMRPNNLDIGNVDSVDKVYRVLTKHLQVEGVSLEACECLKWKYKGNSYLENGNVGTAIDSYNMALSICREMIATDSKDDDNNNNSNNSKKQEGVILLLRASAYLQQAQTHKEILQKAANEWKLPTSTDIQALLLDVSTPHSGSSNGSLPAESKGRTTSTTAAIGLSVLSKLERNGSVRRAQLRKIQYRHGLYQNSLLQAAQDSLRATEILPDYSTSWLRAGELLSDLWKIKESRQYYEKAVTVDEALADSLGPILQRLDLRQRLLDTARATKEWPEDSVRLALDVAG